MDHTNLSSNWKRLQASLKASNTQIPAAATRPQHGVKRKREQPQPAAHKAPTEAPRSRKRLRRQRDMAQQRIEGPANNLSLRELEDADHAPRPRLSSVIVSGMVNAGLSPNIEIGRYVAVDCEMVGVGPNPERDSALARVSIVNYNGDQVYDSYVLPLEPVTDYRTHVSGITPKLLTIARPLKDVQADVAKILQDRVIIGHSLRHDLSALMLGHPQRDIRDTSRHAPYRKIAGGSYPKLKILALELLGTVIQEGEHSSVEDARACMMLFRKDKLAFEREHAKRWPPRPSDEPGQENETKTTSRKFKKKKKKR